MSQCNQCLRAYLPWICTSLAIGYAAYLHWKLNKLKNKLKFNDNNLDKCTEVNIDQVDRNVSKKRVSYCRCWKSKKFPFCDGAHKQHNQDNNDNVGPLCLVWNEDDEEEENEPKLLIPGSGAGVGSDAGSISDPEKEMDIKSIDSESPILQSGNEADSNGEYDQIGGSNTGNNNTGVDHMTSSLEMIDESFTTLNSNETNTKQGNDK